MLSNTRVLIVTLILIATVSCHTVSAQQPVTLSVFNEATTIPFTTGFNTPVHPGAQLGTEFDWKNGNHFRLYPSVNIGYIFHRKLFQGIYTNLELGFDYKSGIGINIKSKIGVGYLHTFTTQQEFQLKNGRYESNNDRGNSRFMPSITLGIGYDLHKNDPYSTEIFILYQSWIEYPYSPGFIPVMAHTNFHIGTKFYPSKFKSKK